MVFSFFISWLLILVGYLQLARKLPELIKKWSEVDVAMQEVYKYPPNLNIKLKKMVCLVSIVSAGGD